MLCVTARLDFSRAGEENDEVMTGGEVDEVMWWSGDLLSGSDSSWLAKRRRKKEGIDMAGKECFVLGRGWGGGSEESRVYCDDQH